jgi:hypothetical protein
MNGMKSNFLVLLVLFVFAPMGSQETIENLDKPLNPKAGRVLQLQEKLRITDEGGQFFLKYPRIFKVAPDGSFFIFDFDQIIHLDSKGQYLGNFFKKGQGPGELNYVSSFDFSQDALIVHSNYPNKFVWFDFKGNVIKEISLSTIANRLEFAFLAARQYYAFKQVTPQPADKPEAVDIPMILMAISEDGREAKETISFPIKSFVMGGAMVLNRLLSVPLKNRHLFVSHTREYSVKVFDCQTQKLLRAFNRKYKRIRPPKGHREAAIVMGDKRYEAPGSEYLADIGELFIFKDVLWVMTSTKDEKKGLLLDVFNLEGKYIDAFYLGTSGRLLATWGDYVFIQEKSPAELIQIVQYKVVE